VGVTATVVADTNAIVDLILRDRATPATLETAAHIFLRNGRRYTTVELIVDDSPWVPERRFSDPDRVVGLRIGWAEKAHQARLRAVQARWDPAVKLWWLPLHLVTQLGLEERIAAWDAPPEGISSKV